MTKFRKLGRPAAHRMSMLRTMVSQLVRHERIETTVAKGIDLLFGLTSNIVRKESFISYTCSCLDFYFKSSSCKAKEVRRLADRMVQLGKEGTLAAARRATAFVRGDDVMHKLFTELAYRYKGREGGYTRLLRTRIRMGDAAPMAYIEFVDRENELREAKPPTPQPPERTPLDPWTRSRISRQWPSATPKQTTTDSET